MARSGDVGRRGRYLRDAQGVPPLFPTMQHPRRRPSRALFALLRPSSPFFTLLRFVRCCNRNAGWTLSNDSGISASLPCRNRPGGKRGWTAANATRVKAEGRKGWGRGWQGEINWRFSTVDSQRYGASLPRRRSKVVISSAKPEDSGRYECVAESTSGHRASLAAQLLVAHDTRIPETKFNKANELLIRYSPAIVAGEAGLDPLDHDDQTSETLSSPAIYVPVEWTG
ncbi:hypothetical protein WN48_05064 [Eufriesea mexicana]|nr:hypothetical protein WN48_05064 [Eufriesea mexicana]